MCSSGDGLQEDAAGAAGDEDQGRPHATRTVEWVGGWNGGKQRREDRFGYDGIGLRILTPRCPAHGRICKDCRRTKPLRQGLQESRGFLREEGRSRSRAKETPLEGWREGPGQEPKSTPPRHGCADLHSRRHSHGGRRYPEDEDVQMPLRGSGTSEK